MAHGQINYHIMNAMDECNDIQRDWMWTLELPSIGDILPMYSTGGFAVRVRTAIIPGATVGALESQFMGTKWYFPGKKEVVSEMSCSFEETEDHYAFSAFHTWFNLIQQLDHTKSNPGVSAMPAKRQGLVTDAYLHLLSYDGQKTRTLRFYNFWPLSMDSPALSYESAANIKYGVNFKFDNWTVLK